MILPGLGGEGGKGRNTVRGAYKRLDYLAEKRGSILIMLSLVVLT